MAKDLGDVVSKYDSTGVTTDGTPTAGDAVAIDQGTGKLSQTNSGDTGGSEEFAGASMAAHGADGDEETLVLSGIVIMNVASGVSAGEHLDASATAGQLAASATGPALALSDEGGSWQGESLGANEAAVYF